MNAKRPLLSAEAGGDEDEDAFAPRNTNTVPVATDRAWAVAFRVNVAITLLAAVYFGGSGFHALEEGHFYPDYDDDNRRRLSSGGGGGGGGLLAPVLFCVGTAGLGWGFAWMMLHLIITFSRQILQAAYLGFIGVSAVAAVTALATGHWLFWLFPALMCAYCARFFWRRQSRMHFSSANLKVAALAVRSMPWTIRVAFLTGGVQLLWLLVWAAAYFGCAAAFQQVQAPGGAVYPASECRTVASPHSCQCRGEVVLHNSSCYYEYRDAWIWAALFWIAGLAWGGGVIRNVVKATVAGSVASWWFSPGAPSPVGGALHRATHGSFGSLCKAAAVSTVVQLFVRVVRRLSKAGRWANFLLEWVRDVVDYVLTYSICFIAIYGLSFSEAGSRVSELFKRRGVTTIANDTVVDVGLTALVTGSAVCFLGAAYLVLLLVGDAVGMAGWTSTQAVAAFLFGYLLVASVVGTTVEVLRSAHKAVFVCFVQDPEALAKSHGRQVYDDLSRAWREMELECPGMASNAIAGHHGGIQDV